MARPSRILYSGAIYHVMSRGNRRGRIFLCDDDRLHFLELLGEARQRYHVKWRVTVLMKTHYHLAAETPFPNISEVMNHVNGEFAKGWNRRHRKTGHVFGERFKAKPVEDALYAQSVVRYILWNPVEAGYVDHPGKWTWSSYRATAGLDAAPDFLDLGWLQGFFGGHTLSDAQRRFVEFVSAGPVDDSQIDQVAVGSDAFKERIRHQIGSTMHQLMVPRSYRALARPTLGTLFAGSHDDLERRNSLIRRAQVVYGYRQSEIARSLNLHPNTVSKIVSAQKKQRFFLVKVT